MELKRVVVTGLGALTPLGNNVEETYTKEEAKEAIETITGKDTVTFNDTNVEIKDSNDIHLRYNRIKISKILTNTVDEDGNNITSRTTYGMASEWLGHNLLYNTYIYRTDRTKNVNLDYQFKDNEKYTRIGTGFLLGIGML